MWRIPFFRHDAYDFRGSHSAMDVARYIITQCTQKGLSVDALQLQRLLYCVQAVFLKKRHQALFADEIEAWPQGPVVRNVFRKYCGYGAAAIYEEKEPDESFSEEERQMMDAVVCEKMSEKPWKLARELRAEGRPWSLIYSDGRQDIIPKDVIAEYEKG